MEIIEKIRKSDQMNDQSQIQKICIKKLQINPLPDKQNEIWRLSNKTKFQRFLNYKFDNKYSIPIKSAEFDKENLIRIYIGQQNNIYKKGNNWEIRTLSEDEITELIEEKLLSSDSNNNWSNLLNHSLSQENNILGLNISGKNIPPIEILTNTSSNFFNAKTLILNVEKNCNVEISQINIGEDDSSLSTSSYIFVGEKSFINHGIISYGKQKSHIINSLNIYQQRNSEYNLGSLQFKFDFARLEISINQLQGHARTIIKGMQITANNEQISTYAKIQFNGPNGFLDQLNKSLANETSHSIFEGIIIVPQIAQRTDASQLSRNLLLSNYAKIDTKPQLEIIADDVKCMHGATISQLNEDEVFYMRSRGLTLEEASQLQLRSYYQEIISFLPITKERWDLLALLLKNK